MHIPNWKKSVWKGYILYGSNYMTFWKRQNYGDIKKLVVTRGKGEYWEWAQSQTQNF